MSTQTITRTNPAAWLLVIAGALSALVGAILWGTGNANAHNDQLGADYSRALGLDGSSSAVAADQTMIGWGVALVVLGVVMVLSWIVIRAARR